MESGREGERGERGGRLQFPSEEEASAYIASSAAAPAMCFQLHPDATPYTHPHHPVLALLASFVTRSRTGICIGSGGGSGWRAKQVPPRTHSRL